MSAPTPEIARYVAQGRASALTHPDFDQLDPYTTAKDTIGSLLHWVESVWNDSPDLDGMFDPEALLGAALIGYHGDKDDNDPDRFDGTEDEATVSDDDYPAFARAVERRAAL